MTTLLSSSILAPVVFDIDGLHQITVSPIVFNSPTTVVYNGTVKRYVTVSGPGFSPLTIAAYSPTPVGNADFQLSYTPAPAYCPPPNIAPWMNCSPVYSIDSISNSSRQTVAQSSTTLLQNNTGETVVFDIDGLQKITVTSPQCSGSGQYNGIVKKYVTVSGAGFSPLTIHVAGTSVSNGDYTLTFARKAAGVPPIYSISNTTCNPFRQTVVHHHHHYYY